MSCQLELENRFQATHRKGVEMNMINSDKMNKKEEQLEQTISQLN